MLLYLFGDLAQCFVSNWHWGLTFWQKSCENKDIRWLWIAVGVVVLCLWDCTVNKITVVNVCMWGKRWLWKWLQEFWKDDVSSPIKWWEMSELKILNITEEDVITAEEEVSFWILTMWPLWGLMAGLAPVPQWLVKTFKCLIVWDRLL